MTANELRISDWSSDVCSSDLHGVELVADHRQHGEGSEERAARGGVLGAIQPVSGAVDGLHEAGAHRLDRQARQRGAPAVEVGSYPQELDDHRSEEHTSEPQSLMRNS